MLRDQLMQLLSEKEEEMISLRRHFHEYPEIPFQEKQTAEKIASYYEGKDIDIQRNVGNGYGIVVTIKEKHPGKKLRCVLILMLCLFQKKQACRFFVFF